MAEAPRAAVCGTSFGCRIHVPALRAAGFDVVALVGRDAEKTARRAARLEIPHASASLDDALALGVDAVTIATPPATHAELTVTAADAGAHVVCEKPFALDADEAERMCEAVVRAGVTHLVGHEFRWAVDRAVAGRALADGRIGSPRLVTMVQYVPLVADPGVAMNEWWFDAARGGGWLGASGSHVVDQVRSWLGEFASVRAGLPLVSDRPSGSAEDSFSVAFTLTSGVEGVLQQTGGAWGPMAGMTRVAGTKGTLWLEEGGVFVADASGVERLPVPTDLELPAPPGESDDPRHRYTHLELGPYIRLCEVLRAGVAGDPLPDAVPIPTFADGVAEMRVLDAIRTSAAAGGTLVPL